MHDTTTLATLSGSTETDPVTMVAISFLSQFPNRNTRAAYMTDLRIYFAWCLSVGVNPLEAKRVHVQAFALHLAEGRGNGPASVSRRIGTIIGYYSTAVLDEVLENTPAHHIRLPKIQEDPTKRTWLTRWELGAVMHSAADSKLTADLALVTLLGVLGMRVTAACNVHIEDMSRDPMGYRYFRTVGKGGKTSNKILPVPTWKAMDRAQGDRTSGPLLTRRDGSQMNRRSAAVVVQRLCKDVGIDKNITPHSFRRSFATLAIAAGVPMDVVRHDMDHESERTTRNYNRLGVDPHSRASNTVAALLAAS